MIWVYQRDILIVPPILASNPTRGIHTVRPYPRTFRINIFGFVAKVLPQYDGIPYCPHLIPVVSFYSRCWDDIPSPGMIQPHLGSPKPVYTAREVFGGRAMVHMAYDACFGPGPGNIDLGSSYCGRKPIHISRPRRSRPCTCA